MTDSDTIFQRFFAGLFVVFVLFGAYTYFERSRTLECLSQAQINGAAAVDAVALCKK